MFKLITAIDRINYFSDNFIAYYKRFFNPNEFHFLVHSTNAEKIKPYLYNHGFTDGEIEEYTIRSFGWGDNIKKQNEVKRRFIDGGCIVLYADQDERIFHPDLRNYILENLKTWIAPTGICLMQHDREPPLDKTKKVLEQRSYGKLDTYWFSKTCILKKDYEWLPGRHTRPPGLQIDPNIYLVDVGKLCKDFMIENNEESKKIYPRLFWRYGTKDKNAFQKVFNEHRGPLTQLPPIIKQSLLF